MKLPFRVAGRTTVADPSDFVGSYAEHARRIVAGTTDRKRALELVIGGGAAEGFVPIGAMQRELLKFAGLTAEGSVIEVGCGVGRLSTQLRDWLVGPYLGTDVVQELLDQAVELTDRPDWRFERVTGLSIPAPDDSADIVCAFSVFTHLLHEASFVYLQDCFRVLKPGAALVFSFLEYRVPSHWHVMEGNIARVGAPGVLNQFMSVDAVDTWAEHLGFQVEGIYRGDEPYIPLSAPIVLSGVEYKEFGTFGQSGAILRKPSPL